MELPAAAPDAPGPQFPPGIWLMVPVISCFTELLWASATIYKAPHECQVRHQEDCCCSMLHVEWLILPKCILTGQDPTADSRTWNCLSLLHLAHRLDPSKTEYNKSQCLKISSIKFLCDTTLWWSKNRFILHFKEQRDSLCSRSWELTNSTITNRSAIVHRTQGVKRYWYST